MSQNLLLSGTKWYPFLKSDDTGDTLITVFFWLTIALVIATALVFALLKPKQRKKFAKVILPSVLVYTCAIIVCFLYLNFKEGQIVNLLFYPLLVLIVVIAVFGVTLCFKRTKPIIILAATATAIALAAVLICMGIYYSSGLAEDFNGLDITFSESVLLYISAILLTAIIIVVAFLNSKGLPNSFDTKSITYASVCIAMSFALSYIRLVKLPQGGSVTVASLLPLMIYSYMFGTKKGIFAGFIYGILQAIQDTYIVHHMQFLLDYPIAFAGIGLAGCFARTKKLEQLPQLQFALGAVVASLFRFAAHIFSGVFAFSEYAYNSQGQQMNAWIYSISYNSFVFVDIAVAIVVGVLVFSSKSFVKQARKYNLAQS